MKINSNIISETLNQSELEDIQTFESLHIGPIISKYPRQSNYITLKDASKANLVLFNETSNVSSTQVDNLSMHPLFLMNGEILEGAKQNRVINDSIIIPSKSKKTVDVSCVEEGRWSNKYKDFKPSDDLFNMRSRWEKSKSVFDTKLRTGSRKSDQTKVWNEIRAKQSRMGIHSDTYSAKDTYAHYEERLRQYEKKLKPLPHQVGLVFYLNNNCAGMDLFDSPQTYQKFSKKIIRSIAIDAIETHLDSRRVSMHKQIAPSIIRQFLDLLSNLKEEVISAPYIGEEIVMNYPELSIYASATSNDNQIIHLTGYHQIDLQASAQTVH